MIIKKVWHVQQFPVQQSMYMHENSEQEQRVGQVRQVKYSASCILNLVKIGVRKGFYDAVK